MKEYDYNYYGPCIFCNKRNSHKGCALPYVDDVTVKDILNKMLKCEDNLSFYYGGKGSNDFALQIDWNKAKKIPLDALDYEKVVPNEKEIITDAADKKYEVKSGLPISDCFAEYFKPEKMEGDN